MNRLMPKIANLSDVLMNNFPYFACSVFLILGFKLRAVGRLSEEARQALRAPKALAS